jgi:hypothetical protein
MKARVFISSAISEFRSERRIARDALSSAYPFLEVWVFEEEGASSASLEQSYQDPLERSDVVVFLLGEDITPPVVAEIDSAIRHNKRTLLILRDVARRTDALQDAIKKLDVKYASYANIESFQGVLRSAIETELVAALQRPPERFNSDPKYRVLRNAFSRGGELRIEPLVGPSSDNRFRIVELSGLELKAEKASSSHQLIIPLTSINEALEDGKEFTIALNGRIQWITSKGFYKLLPSPPKDAFGVPKAAGPGASDVLALQEKLKQRGYYTQWNSQSEVNVWGYEIAYDDDGKYFRCDGRVMPGSVEILAAKK